MHPIRATPAGAQWWESCATARRGRRQYWGRRHPCTPALRLDRRTAHVGDRLCATGTGFLPVDPATVAVDGVAVAQVSTSLAGGFTTCFAAPGSIVAGPNDVSALRARSRSPTAAQFSGLFARSSVSTAYFVSASTAGGDDTSLALVNPQPRPAHVTLTIFLPAGRPFARSTIVAAHARATLLLGRVVAHLRGWGLRVRADQVIAAQMIVSRGHANPYTSLGSGLLARQW